MYERYFKITDPFKFADRKDRKREELKQPKQTTDIRLWTFILFCQSKRVYWLCFIYLFLLNVVIGFGYNHWNLTHNISLGKEKSYVNWFEMDIIVLAGKCFS